MALAVARQQDAKGSQLFIGLEVVITRCLHLTTVASAGIVADLHDGLGVQGDTLTINSDNGPECSGRRTQWLKRLVGLTDAHGITIQLAYYPPYHSKYKSVERLWGILQKHWRGEM